MSQCTNCGAELQSGARFCSVCSYPVGAAAKTASEPHGTRPPEGEAPAALQPNFGTPQGPQPPTGTEPQSFSSGPGAYAAVRTDGQAIAALVCGIAGLVVCPFILSIVAIVLGKNSKTRIQQSNGTLEGEGLANAGFILGIASLALWIVVIGAVIVFSVFLNANM